eukprot:3783451-Prymnesium_polylepis.2
MCAEHVRGGTAAGLRLGMQLNAEFRKIQGLDQHTQMAHVNAMERLCVTASSGNKNALAAELDNRLQLEVAERLVLR